jgi:hypothetical protein
MPPMQRHDELREQGRMTWVEREHGAGGVATEPAAGVQP